MLSTVATNGSKNEPQAPRERGTWTSNTLMVDLMNFFSDQINFRKSKLILKE